MRRVALRVRLTLAFAAIMAAVLATTGGFLYVRLERDLDQTIALGLRSRAGDIAASARRSVLAVGTNALTEQGDSVAQIVRPDGTVLDGTPALRKQSLLTATERAATARGTQLLDVHRTLAGDDPSRLLATRVPSGGASVIVVVGTSIDSRNEALSNLAGLLLVGGSAALVLASLAGYWLAAAALRPVERMRSQAEAVQSTAAGERLDVPPARDEVGRLARTLNAMLDRLERAFTHERTFVADASHELGTPLAILRSELELALRPGRSRLELEDALRSAAEETERLVRLADDLLVVARSDQGELSLDAQEIAAADLLTEVVERFAGRARERDVVVVVDAPDDLRLVADPLRLERAVSNLLDNALRSGARHVSLRARPDHGDVVLASLDDGNGFPDAMLGVAFDRFTRGDRRRASGGPGAGLGLSIVKAIAAAHGGTAGARNRARGGAEVWIRIPGAAARSAGVPATAAPGAAA